MTKEATDLWAEVLETAMAKAYLKIFINRKCAAGTGSFIEELAHRLEVRLEDLPDQHTILLEDAQYCGAYGAALFACGLAEKQARKFSQSEINVKLAR